MSIRRQMSAEQAQAAHDQATATWGLERQPFESDGPYLARVASHWKERALKAEQQLRRPDHDRAHIEAITTAIASAIADTDSTVGPQEIKAIVDAEWAAAVSAALHRAGLNPLQGD